MFDLSIIIRHNTPVQHYLLPPPSTASQQEGSVSMATTPQIVI